MTTHPWAYKLKHLSKIDLVNFEGMRLNFLIQKSEIPRLAAYYIRLPKRTRIPHSYHKIAHEIIVVLSGKGRAHLNSRTFSIRKGHVILVQPPNWHSFSTIDSRMTLLAVTSPYVDSKTDLYHK